MVMQWQTNGGKRIGFGERRGFSHSLAPIRLPFPAAIVEFGVKGGVLMEPIQFFLASLHDAPKYSPRLSGGRSGEKDGTTTGYRLSTLRVEIDCSHYSWAGSGCNSLIQPLTPTQVVLIRGR